MKKIQERKVKNISAFRAYQQPLIEQWRKQMATRTDLTHDPMATVFVGRLSYDADVRDLEDVFRRFGNYYNYFFGFFTIKFIYSTS